MLGVILLLWTKGFQTCLGISVNANMCMFERTHESPLVCSLYKVCQRSTLSWNRQDCNRKSMQRAQNTWSIGTGLCLIARKQILFSKQPFSWCWS